MDPKRFDAISQRLAAIGDRRRVLGALGAFGGLAAIGLPAADVDAKRCIRFNKDCVNNKKSSQRHSMSMKNIMTIAAIA